MVSNVVAFCALLATATGIVYALRDQFGRQESKLVWTALYAHAAAVLAQIVITYEYYGIGDMMAYDLSGQLIADAILYDPGTFLPETLQLIFQTGGSFPFPVEAGQPSTGTMSGLTGLLYAFLGSSLAGTALCISLWAFFGKLAAFQALKSGFHRDLHSRLLIAMLLIPSAVYWSSGIVKESVAIGGLGFMVLGARHFIDARYARAAALLVIGFPAVSYTKPYLLFPFVVATGVWYALTRAERAGRNFILKPIHFFLGLTASVVGLVLLGKVYPRFALDTFSQEASKLQITGMMVEGGSNYSLGSGEKTTAAGQLAFAPVALATALFRPLVFEVRNVLMALGATETMALLVLAFRGVSRRGLTWALALIRSSPQLMFCIAFVLILGVAVGLTTTNLGTLSRYRMPLVPFFAAVLLMLTAPARPVQATKLQPRPR